MFRASDMMRIANYIGVYHKFCVVWLQARLASELSADHAIAGFADRRGRSDCTRHHQGYQGQAHGRGQTQTGPL